MKKRIAKALAAFFLAMLVLTLLSWKLDALRTPQVLWVCPEFGNVSGKQYECVVPLEALHGEGDQYYVYIVENTTSYFHPVTARRMQIQLLDTDASRAAVSGLAVLGTRVVRFSSRPLSGSTVPVAIWEEAAG